MRNRWRLAWILLVLLGSFPLSVQATKRPLLLVGIDVHGRDSGLRAKAASALADTLIKRLGMHLELMGEPLLIPGNSGAPSVKDVSKSCPRECQLELAQRWHADILRGEVVRDGEAYDITLSLWRFALGSDRPLTEYPIDQQASCDSCSEQQLAHAVNEQAARLLARPQDGREPAPVAIPVQPAPPQRSVQERLPAGPRPPIPTARKVAGGVFGGLAALSLGVGATLALVNAQVPQLSLAPLDMKTSLGIYFGAAATSGVISLLLLTIPERRPTRPTGLMLASWRN